MGTTPLIVVLQCPCISWRLNTIGTWSRLNSAHVFESNHRFSKQLPAMKLAIVTIPWSTYVRIKSRIITGHCDSFFDRSDFGGQREH